ncbi:uncharacterized protein LOC111058739 [Nilaparvata lugens]|uniref:uncharacterized protein LOC111058739 n=1 Tax=Nilaparvata lugens TaxID=108931 RepID=UPI000B990535|nr:uncharacterized protein LOC111058739 [Nilaparvata lugens]
MICFTGLVVVLTCCGFQDGTWAMPDVNFGEYHSVSSSQILANREIPSIDEFLDNMSEKYAIIEKEIEELQQHTSTFTEQHSIDCHSSRASQLMSMKRSYDFCNDLTEKLKKLKNATINSLEIISEIGYSSSEIISGGIRCFTYESSSSQLSCFIELFLHSRLFFEEITPKIFKLMNSAHVFVRLINFETFYCLFHHHIDTNTAKEIAQTYLKCSIDS